MTQMYEQVYGLTERDARTLTAVINRGDDFADLPERIWMTLYAYWLDHGMPYGIAKARTGDPYQWIQNEMVKV